MLLSNEAKQLLGFDYCLHQLRPLSPYGQALKAQLSPYLPGQEEELNQELDAVDQLLSFLQNPAVEGHLLKTQHLLAQIPDWREPLNRVAAGGVLTDVELFGLKQNILFIRAIKAQLAEPKTHPWPNLDIPDFPLLLTILDPDKTDSPAFYLSDNFSPRLAEIRTKIREHQRLWTRLTEQMRKKATELTGLKFNPSGEISVPRHDRSLRLSIENAKLFTVSRETYTDIYYELKPSQQELAVSLELERLEKQESEEEERVRTKLSAAVKQDSERLLRAFNAIGKLDLTLSKAVLARNWGANRPQVQKPTEPMRIIMQGARHPKVAAELADQDKDYTPITIVLAQGVSIITGANMGGKTVTLRTVGLLTSLAAYGLFVPAAHFVCSLVSHICILAGDYRSDLTGLSRFGHEVASLNEILSLAPKRSLLLIDELASSTNPAEGSVLAQAVVEHLHAQPSITLLTTHFDRLADLPGVAHWQVIGLSEVRSDTLQGALSSDSLRELSDLMDYSLCRVQARTSTPREALRVARYLRLPDSVLQRAGELLQRSAQGGVNYEED